MTSVLHGQRALKPGGEKVQRHVARSICVSASHLFASFFIYASSLSFSYLHRVEEQALGEVGAPLFVVHLLDQVVDLLHHVLERPLELALGGDFADRAPP